MTQELIENLEDFVSRLDSAQEGSSDWERRALANAQVKVAHILDLIATRTSDEVGWDSIVAEYEALERFVSDSLPWRGEILESWSRVSQSWARI